MTKHETSALLLSLFAIIYVGCGRNELDDGFPTTNIDNGTGGTQGGGGTGGLHGSGGSSGSGGAVGGSSGSGGRVGSGGSGGRVGSGGSGGSGGTGGSGGSVGSGGSGGSGGRVGSGGSGGSVGSGGSGGSVGGGISCGNLTCQSNKESCCIQVANGRATETCIPAGASCQGGPSIGCLGGDCGDGRVCCFSLIGLNTTCAAPQQCNNGLSTVLCASDRDCPAARNHCCQTGPIRTCRATACGGGPGGAPTPGPGPGRPGR